jgi:CheY-like chemotaxis protein
MHRCNKRIASWESDAPAGHGLRGQGCRVLVVEDHRETADSLRELLELWGHQVAVVYTGPAGVEAARQLQPDVLLCDLGLPGLDGYGVAAALRRGPDPLSIRMIAISAYGQEEYKIRSLESGFDLHMTKPIDFDHLKRLLTTVAAPKRERAGR